MSSRQNSTNGRGKRCRSTRRGWWNCPPRPSATDRCDVHDNLMHHLTVLTVQLEIPSEFGDMDPGAVGRALAEGRESVRLALAEAREPVWPALGDVRRSVRALREEVPRPALSAAFAGWAREGGSGPRVTVEVTGEENGYDIGALTAMYRAAQVGLTNELRHARCTRASVDLRPAEDTARLTVVVP
ncbi:sensor histidine kinase [Streptomyces sp. WSLK1-3]|uniref:sensor histidine kinase n=1 Tax=Streptomyces sp. WSLK1-3 TaxID=3375475 RepID=UPI00378BB948